MSLPFKILQCPSIGFGIESKVQDKDVFVSVWTPLSAIFPLKSHCFRLPNFFQTAHSNRRVSALLFFYLGHFTPKYRWYQTVCHLAFSLNITSPVRLSWPAPSIVFPTRVACLLSFQWHLILCSPRFICCVAYCVSMSLDCELHGSETFCFGQHCSQHLDQGLTHSRAGAQWIYAA